MRSGGKTVEFKMKHADNLLAAETMFQRRLWLFANRAKRETRTAIKQKHSDRSKPRGAKEGGEFKVCMLLISLVMCCCMSRDPIPLTKQTNNRNREEETKTMEENKRKRERWLKFKVKWMDRDIKRSLQYLSSSVPSLHFTVFLIPVLLIIPVSFLLSCSKTLIHY